MNPLEPEVEGLAVVALGGFNPAIFHPSWLAANELIRDEEADEAKVEHVTPLVSVFEAGFFRFQIIPERLSVETDNPSGFLPLKDLCIATFEILEHTPIRAFGLNSHQHFKMDSADDWHRIGHYFTPKTTWERLLDTPGMERIAIQGTKADCSAKRITIRLEPSTKCENGVYMTINQHYDLAEQAILARGGTSEVFADALKADWETFMTYRSMVAQTVFEDALSGSNGS